MMKKTLYVPKFREEGGEGVLCAWMKEEGASFEKGEILYEVETDKVVESVEAPEQGMLIRKLAAVGDAVRALEPVAEVEEK